jgi:transposase
MARYGQAFKNRAVARVLPPESAPLELVAREFGIGVVTLERWRAEVQSKPARGRAWTAAARLDAVIATAAMDEASKSAWCRELGVYPTELDQWRASCAAALADPEAAPAGPDMTLAARKRIKELEREVQRKNCALAETAALLVLSKKAAAIFHQGEDV